MQKFLSICFIAMMISATTAVAAPLAYTFDPAHTQVLFSWSHLGFSHPTGQFDEVQGTLTYDADDPAHSSVRVRIPVASLHTHVPVLDKELQGAQFLGAKKYPAITFVSTKVTPSGKNAFRVDGNLSVHGMTHPVTLHVTLNKAGSYPMIDAPALGFAAMTTIQRSAFGVNAGIPMVGDALQVNITAEAIESKAFADKIAPMEKAGQ